MRVLVACEFSQIVCAAFRARGHDAYSCDKRDTEGDPRWHFKCDVRTRLRDGWDLMIAHPDCTFMCTSGARWMRHRMRQAQAAVDFVDYLLDAPIPKKVIENPKSILSTAWRKPDQVIHPWMFGDPERKETWIWIEGDLPLLTPTNPVVPNEVSMIHHEAPGINRSKNRSRTFPGIANAMAAQWG